VSSVPGPIISFRVGTEFSGAIRPVLDQIKTEAKAASQQIADDWKRMAAQIRASVTTEASGTKEIAAQRQQLVSILDKEISGLRTRNELTTKELASLKAQTLERERQLDALKRGSSVGIAFKPTVPWFSDNRPVCWTRAVQEQDCSKFTAS
jgi:hypothetical protein